MQEEAQGWNRVPVLPGVAHQPRGEGGASVAAPANGSVFPAPECSVPGAVITRKHIRSLSNLVNVGDEHQRVQGASTAEYKLTTNAKAPVHQTLCTVTSFSTIII